VSEREWVLLVYRVPTEPAGRRVTIWRDFKRLGALYLQQCVCILPRRDDVSVEIDRIIAKLVAMEGEFTRFDLPPLPLADEAKIVASFRTLRDKEYAEIVEECATKFVREIEFERFRANYTFEEAEEIGQDLEKIRRWFKRIEDRDWFQADGRQTVETWIERCQTLLDDFEQDVYRLNGDDADTNLGPAVSSLPFPQVGSIAPPPFVAPVTSPETKGFDVVAPRRDESEVGTEDQ